MLPRHLIPIIAISGLIMTIGILFIGDIQTQYGGSNIDNEGWEQTFDVVADMHETTESIERSINFEEKSALDAFIQFFVGGVTGIMKLTWSAISFPKAMVEDTLNGFNVPSTVASPLAWVIIIVFITSIVFAIISSVLRGRL